VTLWAWERWESGSVLELASVSVSGVGCGWCWWESMRMSWVCYISDEETVAVAVVDPM
jgi:hypothetical protein